MTEVQEIVKTQGLAKKATEVGKEVMLSRAELLIGIRRIWNLSVLVVYPQPGDPNVTHPILDPRATLNYGEDGSRCYAFKDGLWLCERTFSGGGLREFDYVDLPGEYCDDLAVVTYRKKKVWKMYCDGWIRSPSLRGGKLVDILQVCFQKAVLAKTEYWRRTQESCCGESWVLRGDQFGGLGHFSGTERLYNSANEVAYQGEVLGSLSE